MRLAHQRVLESWKRAQQIVAANADFYRIRHEIDEQHRRWKASGGQRDLLLAAGLPLAEAESVRGRYAGELPAELNDLHRRVGVLRGRARQQFLRVAVAAFALLALIAAAAGIWAVHQQRKAEASLRDSRTATSKFLADLARQRLAEDRVGEAVALARRAVPVEIKDWPRVPTAEDALALAMQAYSSAPARPVVGFVGHEGTVRGAEFSPDGKRLLTWSYDATARLWDVETGTQLKVLQHDAGLRGARFSSDGRRALSWSFDGSVRLWDLAGNNKGIVLRHDDVVIGAAFSSDESRVLSWSYDGTARVWDAKSGRQLVILRHPKVVEDARYFQGDQRILTRSFDGDVRIWRASDGAHTTTLKHAGYVRGAILFAHETRVLTWSDDKTARVWDTGTGEELNRLEHPGGVRAGVTAAELSADEHRIVTQSDNLAIIWDAATGKQLARFAHQGKVLGTQLSKSGARLLTWSTDRAVQLWNTTDGKLIVRTSHSEPILGARFSPDERLIVSWSYDGTAHVLSESKGIDQSPIVLRHEGVVRDAYVSANGAWIWTRSDDGTVRAWSSVDGRQGAVLRHQAEVLGMLWSSAGDRPVTYSADGTARLWDLSPAHPFVELRHDDKVLGATFASDGDSLLTWSSDHTARVWDVATGERRLALREDAGLAGAAFTPDQGAILTWSTDGSIRLWDRANGTSRAVFNVPSPARGALLSSANDRLLGWFGDGSIHLWNSKTHEQMTEFAHCGERAGGRFSPDGRVAVIWCSDGTLRVLDSERAVVIASMVHPHLSAASLSSDRARVLSWADDGTIRVWNIHGGAPAAEMHEQGSVLAAVLSPRGDRVLSWAGANTATIWDAGTGKKLVGLPHAKVVNGALFDTDGRRVWTWSMDGSARLWDSTTGNELWRLQLADGVQQLEPVADGRFIFTQTQAHDLKLWDAGTGDLVFSAALPTSTAQASNAGDRRGWPSPGRVGRGTFHPGVALLDPDGRARTARDADRRASKIPVAGRAVSRPSRFDRLRADSRHDGTRPRPGRRFEASVAKRKVGFTAGRQRGWQITLERERHESRTRCERSVGGIRLSQSALQDAAGAVRIQRVDPAPGVPARDRCRTRFRPFGRSTFREVFRTWGSSPGRVHGPQDGRAPERRLLSAAGLLMSAPAPPLSHPPKPRLALAVGVIGHRPNRLPEAGRDQVTLRIAEALSLVAKATHAAHERHAAFFSPEPPVLRLVSAVAEGADRMAAHAALDGGYTLTAVLPFAIAEYERDFIDESSRAEYQRLLERTESTVVLCGARSDGSRPYELVGDTVIANADLVLAVWDGGPSGGHGGTTELVQDAAHAGLPIIHVDAAGREPTRIVWAGFGPLLMGGHRDQ